MHSETSTFTPSRVLNLVNAVFALSEEERGLLLSLVGDRPLTYVTTITGIEHMRHRYAQEGINLLSDREKAVLSYIMGGKGNKEIARLLGISPNTVQAHRRRGKDKLGAETTADLVRLATASGLQARF